MKILTMQDFHFRKRLPSSRKGDHGRVLVVGGSETYAGAPALCGLAALRSGCDWVTIAAPEKVAWAINCLTPDVVTVKLPGKELGLLHANMILSLAEKHDAVALGNGIGLSVGTRKLVHLLIKKIRKPLVIDADALKVIRFDELYGSRAILTPHVGEFWMLLEHSGIPPRGKRHVIPWGNIQKRIGGNVLLLKGPTDYIASKHDIVANTMHDPSMTVAGTGDVLAGLCAGFAAQGHTVWEAACMGAFFNGLTGMWLAKKKGYPSLIASDIVRDIQFVKKMAGSARLQKLIGRRNN